jgi:hypothetical protein
MRSELKAKQLKISKLQDLVQVKANQLKKDKACVKIETLEN